MPQPVIAAVVVTYNRKMLLLQCLFALSRQTLKPEFVIIIDNASTDGTLFTLQTRGLLDSGFVNCLRLEVNMGGSGGFSYGLSSALDRGADWVWMMDDDAIPHSDALAELMKAATSSSDLYGSTPVFGNTLS